VKGYLVDVNTTMFITTVLGLVTTNLGALYFVAGRLGNNVDHLSDRVDSLDGRLTARIDTMHDAVADLAARMAVLERH
jgi:hypothetical protein